MWKELTPEVDGHGVGATAENTDKMVLEGLDGAFCHVAVMVVRRNKFVGHAGRLNGLFVVC